MDFLETLFLKENNLDIFNISSLIFSAFLFSFCFKISSKKSKKKSRKESSSRNSIMLKKLGLLELLEVLHKTPKLAFIPDKPSILEIRDSVLSPQLILQVFD